MFLLNEQLIVPNLYADMTGWVEMHKYWKGGDLTRVDSSGRVFTSFQSVSHLNNSVLFNNRVG